ncbi:MAG TPA: MFS transporter [Candidatus Dormibacteraeota bacterium]
MDLRSAASSRLTSPRKAAAFIVGSAAVTAGVCLHLPMLLGAGATHYRLVGMPVDGLMTTGMVLIGLGLIGVVYGLAPVRAAATVRTDAIRVGTLDTTRIGRAHVLLLLILVVAIAIDAMKPFTFTFILPGVAKEYGLSAPGHAVHGALPVALYPFCGITGTVIGSFLWGSVADRFGRRRAVLLAVILFMATAICGAMPAFVLNLVMCFFMGIGAGGLLPIAYTLLSETMPARHRGMIVVLIAGAGTALGFLITGAIASWQLPILGWRVMWFWGLPTGVILIALNRFIPESPRFLIDHGRSFEAHAVMRRFGAVIEAVPVSEVTSAARVGWRTLAQGRLLPLTVALVLYGLAWGIVDFGFLTWLPVDLAGRGIGAAKISGILTNASFFALPGAVVVAWLYGRWSSKWTMVLVAVADAAALAAFALVGPDIAKHITELTILVVCLLITLWGVIAVLAPYSTEVYPTALRGRGSGLAAGASKLGGVIALGIAVLGIAPPALGGAAAIAGGAMLVAAVAVGSAGIETRDRRLEEISASPLVASGARG